MDKNKVKNYEGKTRNFGNFRSVRIRKLLNNLDNVGKYMICTCCYSSPYCRQLVFGYSMKNWPERRPFNADDHFSYLDMCW